MTMRQRTIEKMAIYTALGRLFQLTVSVYVLLALQAVEGSRAVSAHIAHT